MPLLVSGRDALRNRSVRRPTLSAQQYRLGRHLSTLEINDFLEAKRDDVWSIRAGQGVVQEIDVVWGPSKMVWPSRIHIP